MKKYKVVGAGLLTGLLFLGVSPQAKAVTLNDLYNEITGLKQQVAQLKAQVSANVNSAFSSSSTLQSTSVSESTKAAPSTTDAVSGSVVSPSSTVVTTPVDLPSATSVSTPTSTTTGGTVDTTVNQTTLPTQAPAYVPATTTPTATNSAAASSTTTSTTTSLPDTNPWLHPSSAAVSAPVQLTPVSQGASGDAVKALQQYLIQKGYLSGDATGLYGTKTQKAVKALQIANGIVGDGTTVGPKTLKIITSGGGGTTFQPCSALSPASIKVITPNGGEVFTAGQSVTVTWQSCKMGSTVNISVSWPNSWTPPSGVMTTTVPNTSMATITLPSASYFTSSGTLQYGANFKITIGSNSSALQDSSDNPFSIVSAASSSCVLVTKNIGFANQNIQTASAGNKVGSFIVVNQCGYGISLTSLTTVIGGTVAPSNISDLSNLALYNGSVQVSSSQVPGATNTFSFGTAGIFVPSFGSTTFNVFADTGYSSALPGKTIIMGIASGQALNANTATLVSYGGTTGQTITIVSPSACAATPTLLSSSSTSPQYISSGATSTTNTTQATFNFYTNTGASTITELKFAVPSSNIASVTVGSVTTPVVGGVAYLTGLLLFVPNGGSGINVPAYFAYPTVGTAGIASGSTASATLTYEKFSCGSNVVVSTPSVTTPTMMLVASKPVIVVNAVSTSGLVIGTNKLADFSVTADASGTITLNQIPFTFSSSGSTTLSVSALQLKDSLGLPVSGATCTATVCSISGGYVINAGSTKAFSLYGTVSGTLSTSPTSSVTTTLGAASSFSWTDTAGGATSAQTTNNATYLYGYPTASAILHN